MKVRFLASVLIDKKHHEEGSVHELDNDTAKEMIKLGRAELAVVKDKKKTEDGEEPEKADITAKELFDSINLSFADGRTLLKDQFSFQVERGSTLIPGDLAEQVVASQAVD